MEKFDFDLLVIGAGSGGVRAARLAGAMGRKVAIVEESRVGGTCVMRGCVPKKLLVHGAHFADDFADARGFGWEVGETSFDWPALIAAKNRELDRLEGVYGKLLANAGVRVIEGRGRLLDPHAVEVEGRRLSAGTILIATGSRPVLPPVPGIEHAVTSNEALDLPALPRRVAIVGGGYIAVEFAGIFNALGSRVELVIRAPEILRGFDNDVRSFLAAEMSKRGIDIHRETVVENIAHKGVGFHLGLSGGGEAVCDLVMYATGRAPNTRGLGLVETGVELDAAGAVMVDDFSRSSVPSIYAIGDVTNRVNLTPVALAEGCAFVDTVFGGRPAPMRYDNVPSAVFGQPPVGAVGLTEDEARALGDIDVYISTFRPLRHTLSGRDEKTMMKLIVHRRSDRVLGVHMVGADAPEIVQGFAVALTCGATKAQFDATVGIHPTAAEEFVTLREKRAGGTA